MSKVKELFKKRNICLLMVVICGTVHVVFGVFVYFYTQNKKLLYPSSEVSVDFFTSPGKAGRCQQHGSDTGEGIVMRFNIELDEEPSGVFSRPCAQIMLRSEGESFFDFSSYDYIEFSVKTERMDELNLTMLSAMEDFPPVSGQIRELYRTATKPGHGDRVRFYFDELQVPSWWYVENKLSKADPRIIIDETQVTSIRVGSSLIHPYYTESVLQISQIELGCSNKIQVYLHAAFSVLYVVVVLVSVFRYAHSGTFSGEPPRLHYRMVTIKNDGDERLRLLTDYLGENFSREELTIDIVSQDTHLSSKEVSQLIKQNTKNTFPGYINLLRIEKATELLLSSEKKIIDIVHDVGFGSVAHFNLTFKKITGLSPTGFKDKFADNE